MASFNYLPGRFKIRSLSGSPALFGVVQVSEVLLRDTSVGESQRGMWREAALSQRGRWRGALARVEPGRRRSKRKMRWMRKLASQWN